MVETAEDVVSQLAPLGQIDPGRRGVPTIATGAPPIPSVGGSVDPVADDAALDLVLRLLGPTPIPVDELVRQCQLTAAAVATLVLELELAGRVERHPGNLVSLR